MKLVKIMKGLYRNEGGTIVVAYQLKWRGKPAHWEVRYTNFFGAKVIVEFPTLKDAKDYLKKYHQ